MVHFYKYLMKARRGICRGYASRNIISYSIYTSYMQGAIPPWLYHIAMSKYEVNTGVTPRFILYSNKSIGGICRGYTFVIIS